MNEKEFLNPSLSIHQLTKKTPIFVSTNRFILTKGKHRKEI